MTRFAERYRQALAFKSLDVEEWIDRYFHRPIAAAVAALLIPLPVSPNHVTLSSLFMGWTGSIFLYRAFFVDGSGPVLMWLLAAAFLFAAVILDCADGQLARSRGGGSRVGRILDGIVDALVLIPAYVILGFGIDHLYGSTWLTVASVAGFSTWLHCLIYDKIKNVYLAQTMPEAGGAEGTETVEDVRRDQVEAQKNGSLLDRFLLAFYITYIRLQEHFASGSVKKKTDELSAEKIEGFRRRNRSTMRLASILGLGTHMFVIYGSIALMAIEPRVALGAQVLFATVFNVVLVIVLWRSRGFDGAQSI